ncbi:uncharacterized protein LOC131942347 isoform X4 [Physella acuta]|uniref:uncharacterized protein LOC131942347 isoform X4 n=1 Tax=Physella acuta TaxID=109671 RepID=UPI0027DBCF78|nr:uncharacterized protein LOC131942347 isoform X4 [Physella acuta]
MMAKSFASASKENKVTTVAGDDIRSITISKPLESDTYQKMVNESSEEQTVRAQTSTQDDVTSCFNGTHEVQECLKGQCEADLHTHLANYNKIANAATNTSQHLGTHEVQECLKGQCEADLHTHLANCKKNPGHTGFIPVKKVYKRTSSSRLPGQ